MSAIRYPIAADAEMALNAPLGRAEREREARDVARGEVVFTTEAVGPSFPTREAALAAWRGRVDDDGGAVAAEDRCCQLREVIEPTRARQKAQRPVEPTFEEGRRWPKPAGKPAKAQWRLSVSYWRVEPKAVVQARRAR